jgi:hypothetical protein
MLFMLCVMRLSDLNAVVSASSAFSEAFSRWFSAVLFHWMLALDPSCLRKGKYN